MKKPIIIALSLMLLISAGWFKLQRPEERLCIRNASVEEMQSLQEPQSISPKAYYLDQNYQNIPIPKDTQQDNLAETWNTSSAVITRTAETFSELISEPVLEQALGTEAEAETEAETETETIEAYIFYVLNTNTKKFHYPSCSDVENIKQKNRQDYTGTRDEVIGMGYQSCGHCNP